MFTILLPPTDSEFVPAYIHGSFLTWFSHSCSVSASLFWCVSMQSVVGESWYQCICMSNLSSHFCHALWLSQVQCTQTDSDTTHVKTIANIIMGRSLPNTNGSGPLDFTIADGGFMCGHNPEQMTFRAKLVATGQNTSVIILSYLQEWLHSNDVINVNGAILRLNRMCNVSISLLGANLCDTKSDTQLTITTQPQRDSEIPQHCSPFSLGAIIGGLGAALVLTVITTVAIVAVCHSKCIRRTGR